MDPMLREIEELLKMSYPPMTPPPPYPSTFASSSAAPAVSNVDIGLFHGLVEAGPPGMSTASMPTSPPIPSKIWTNDALTHFNDSVDLNHAPLQNEPNFHPSIYPTLFLADWSSPHTAAPGGMSGLLGWTGMPSQFHSDGHGHALALEFPSVAPQDPAFASGYGLLNPSAQIAIPSPPSIPESPTYYSANDPPSPSSPRTLKPDKYYFFFDLDGVKKYLCFVCGKCIRKRPSNFEDHLKIHNAGRERFDCDWPGCGELFTRKRDQTRHIEEDHLGTRPRRLTTTAKKPRKEVSTGKRKGGQRKKD